MKKLPAAALAAATLATALPAGAAIGLSGLAPGSLRITEVMPDPLKVSDSRGEWFEVFNASASTIDLRGLMVSSPDGTRTDTFTVTRSAEVAPGDWFVFGRNADPALNGGVVVDYAWGTKLSLGNSDDSVSIAEPDGSLLWSFAWYRTDAGRSLEARRATGTSVLPYHLVSASNAVPYGLGDFGTPGSANEGELRWVVPTQPVPEPGTWAMLVTGLGLLALSLRRRGVRFGGTGGTPAAAVAIG
jgi:hypothetical protein